MHCRRADPADASLVAEVLSQSAAGLEARGEPLWSAAEVSEAVVAPHVAQGLYYLVFDGSEAVGVFRYQLADRHFWPDLDADDSAFVHKLAVHPARQGTGLAQVLLGYACDIARQQGRRYLRLDCMGGRPRLRAIYERFGFRHHSDKELGGQLFHRFELAIESSPGSTPLQADLARVTAPTLDHYNRRAAQFWEGTRGHDVTQNIEALLRHIEAAPPLRILDFGCGPGRDLAALRARGHAPVGLDGSAQFAEMARAHSGCEVWHQDFLALQLPEASFDGIFANASLFHVPSGELPRVLAELHATLKPGGVLFASNPRGNNEEGWNAGRYGVYHDLASWRAFLEAARFTELEHYYRPPGLPREQQPWLASVWRKARTTHPL